MMLKLKEGKICQYVNMDRVVEVTIDENFVILFFSQAEFDYLKFNKSSEPESYNKIKQYLEQNYG